MAEGQKERPVEAEVERPVEAEVENAADSLAPRQPKQDLGGTPDTLPPGTLGLCESEAALSPGSSAEPSKELSREGAPLFTLNSREDPVLPARAS